MTHLIYPAVWLTFCRGLPLTDSERASRKSILFLCSISLVRFLSTLYLWPILFTLEWKTNSHLVFLIRQKIWKELVCDRSLRLLSLGTFQAFVAFAPLPFLQIPEGSRIIIHFLNPKNHLWYIPCLFTIVPAQERWEQSIYHWGWKGSDRYSDADYFKHSIILACVLFLFLHTYFFLKGGGGGGQASLKKPN